MQVACLTGIARWKRRRVRAMLGDVPVRADAASAVALARERGGAVAVWASRVPDGLLDRAAAAGVPVWWVEDGFLRSVGLGAALVQPASLTLDRRGLYYDPHQPSDLEHLLQTADFSLPELDRAAALRDAIVRAAVTKYNLGGRPIDLPPGRRVVLVPGQVEDDRSVRLGGVGMTMLDLLARTRAEEPGAYILYKPHPDVVAGLRDGILNQTEVLRFADRMIVDADLAPLLDRVDAVHTLTSLTGFEALLRGREVVVHGQPFYAGWGLTRDLAPVPRRTRRRTLDELVAATLIAYPLYADPRTGRKCEPERVVAALSQSARPAPRNASPVRAIAARIAAWHGRRRRRRRTGKHMTPIYDIWRLLHHPRTESEAEIRELCRVAYLGDHNALCRVLGRYKMYVDTRDTGIASHLMLDGFWEMWVTEAMMRTVQRGSTVIDVGANLGYFTVLLADLTGPEGRCLSFEPNPEMANRTRRSIEVNGFGGFTALHDCALGAAEGLVDLEIRTDQPGGGRVHEHEGAAGAGSVAVRRLDSFPEALDASFIKIDVEGYEQQVWRGMTGILARGHPLTIFMEFTVSRYPDPRGFLAEITGEGFTLEIIDFNRGIVPITVDEIMAQSHNIDHMLCFRR